MQHSICEPTRFTAHMRWVLLGVACLLAGCEYPGVPVIATPMPDPLPVDGIGYLIFNSPIMSSSRDQFIIDVDKLRNAGAREIHIGLNSPGGEINAAQGMVDYINLQHDQNGLVFKAYNIGLVASAATYVFLNTQDRYSIPRGVFLFHAAGVFSKGMMNAQMLRDQADKLDAYERIMRAALKARTNLTDSEAQTYVRRTVVLNSDDAQRDGVVEAISAFVVPKKTRVWFIQSKTRAVTAPRPASLTGSPTP